MAQPNRVPPQGRVPQAGPALSESAVGGSSSTSSSFRFDSRYHVLPADRARLPDHQFVHSNYVPAQVDRHLNNILLNEGDHEARRKKCDIFKLKGVKLESHRRILGVLGLVADFSNAKRNVIP